MRITRSTLRRIIAEESACILAETKKGTHERVPGGHQMRMAAGFEDEPEEEDWDDEGGDDEEWAEEQEQGVMDYYGHPDPFGDDEAAEGDLVYDGAGGWRKKTDDEWAAEQEQGVMDYYGDPDPYGDDEALEKGYEYDGAGGWKKPSLDEGEDDDYEDEPEAAEMGDPEDPYGDMPKGEHPRGGLVHTAGFKGGSPAGALLRRREEFPEHPSGLTGMGGPYSEYDHLHYGAGINEARWAKIAGVLKD